LERLDADSDAGLIEKFEWTYVRQALTDHLVWGYALLFHGFAFVLYSYSLFLVSFSWSGIMNWSTHLLFSQRLLLASVSQAGKHNCEWWTSKIERCVSDRN
jgi:hypothetical protein